MPWLRLDDTLGDHPKFFGIDPRAGWLWVLGLCYAGRHALNGRLPKEAAYALAATVDSQASLVPDEPEPIRQLVTRGLWERKENEYRIHDYLDYNPSRKQIMAERRAARARSRKARQTQVSARVRSGELRANFARSSRPRPVPSRPDVTTKESSLSFPDVAFTPEGFVVRPDLLEQWSVVFAPVDVGEEIRQAHTWALANPPKRNWHRFLVNWLSKAKQDLARVRGRPRETIAQRAERYGRMLAERGIE